MLKFHLKTLGVNPHNYYIDREIARSESKKWIFIFECDTFHLNKTKKETMSIIKLVGKYLDKLNLKNPINELRFSVTRPDWWVHEKKKENFFSEFVRPNSLCFDIGASNGSMTQLFRKLGASVISIEPQPSCLSKLSEIFRNDLYVTIVGKAVGSQIDQAEMKVAGDGSQISSLSDRWISLVRESKRFGDKEWSERMSVELTTLDELVEKYGVPAFCKIDVEGYEPLVISGLTQPLKTLSLEYTPEYYEGLANCIEALSKLGKLKLNFSVHGKYELYWLQWSYPDEFIEKLANLKEPACSIGGDVYINFVS